MKEVIEALAERRNEEDDKYYSDSLSNFSRKLTEETITYRDVLDIADILGYEIQWVEKC